MNKKERKANEALQNAYAYMKTVSERMRSNTDTRRMIILKKRTSVAQEHTCTKASAKPAYDGRRIDKAVAIKVSKANFKVLATSAGQTFEVQKRFKSITAANSWINEHISC